MIVGRYPARALKISLLALLGWALIKGPPCSRNDPEPAPQTRYDGYAVARVHSNGPMTTEAILEQSTTIWSDGFGPDFIDVVVSEAQLNALKAAGLRAEVLIPDLQASIDGERARIFAADDDAPWFSEYRDFTSVMKYMDSLAERAPDRVAVEKIGGSVEGRPIRAFKIAADPSKPNKPRIVLNGGIHAREWIGVMVATCIADRLARGYEGDLRIRSALDQYEFAIVPVVNPDGYQYAWNVDRMWRKNRRAPHGVDLNRNFGVGWGGRGSSGRSRSEIYRGPSAFSEPETRAMRALISERETAGHIDIHSFGQLLLFPWSHTTRESPHRDKFAALADRMVTAMFVTNNKRYRMLQGSDLYVAGGTMTDFVYGDQDTISFTLELRPRFGNGFILPPEQIVPTCEESLAAVLEMTEHL